ncbi:MAG TPA: TraM recognition domain-containing protein [Chloroflexota bacterium]|nr:TraM recognition domain-containing protein [Chloroflexota bacterium]
MSVRPRGAGQAAWPGAASSSGAHWAGGAEQHLVEIVTPRTNAAAISPAENFFAAISLSQPFALEIAATRHARWFLARAAGEAMRAHLEDQLGVAYPQAELRRLDTARLPQLDPARAGPDEQVRACVLRLRHPEYLPLRTFSDREMAADQAAHATQADPLLPILGAMGDLPEGWRALSQLVLQPVADDWCRRYLRLAVEHPLAAERASAERPSLLPVFLLAGTLAAGAAVAQGHAWYQAGDWPRLGLLALGGAAIPPLCWRISRWGRRPPFDPQLVQQKISRIAYRAELRLAVFAPAGTPPAALEGRLTRLVAAYRQFNLAAGNSLWPQRLRLDHHPSGGTVAADGEGQTEHEGPPGPPGAGRRRDLRSLGPLLTGPWPWSRRAAVLNTRELAGLWHLPQALSDVPLLERTTARRRLPLPGDVADGCRIGVSSHLGRTVPVALPEALLHRHLLLVAKTRRGKSSLLMHIARYLIATRGPGEPPGTLVLIDPHRDLARATLGLVPAERRGDVVSLDLAHPSRLFGINLLDTGLGWTRDKAVANALSLFKREFDQFWGPRMEDAFRFALLTLYEANEAISRRAPDGRRQQFTVLQVPAVLSEAAFRRDVLSLVRDPMIGAWWSSYYDRLDRKFQLQIVNPVLTKVSRFAGSLAGRGVVGQARSTIDPASWLRRGTVVVVNTAKGVVGEDTAALIGGCMVNLVGLLVGEQASLAPERRRRVTIIVDECHTMPGADYEAILAELAKYGANLILATQSLAQLEALDDQQQRALRATLFSNLDGLFAFHTSAEDARYLVRELGGEVDEQDLLELGDYRCYVKLSSRGERLPVFSVELEAPPASDEALAEELAAASAARYGREREAIEAELAATLARAAPAAVGSAAAPPATAPVAPPGQGAPALPPGSAPGRAPAGGPGPPKKVRRRGRPKKVEGR